MLVKTDTCNSRTFEVCEPSSEIIRVIQEDGQESTQAAINMHWDVVRLGNFCGTFYVIYDSECVSWCSHCNCSDVFPTVPIYVLL